MPVFGKQQKKSGPVRRACIKITRGLLWCIVPCYAMRRHRCEKSTAVQSDRNGPPRKVTTEHPRDDDDMVDENSRTSHGEAGDTTMGRRDKKIAVSAVAMVDGGTVVGRVEIPTKSSTGKQNHTTEVRITVAMVQTTVATMAGAIEERAVVCRGRPTKGLWRTESGADIDVSIDRIGSALGFVAQTRTILFDPAFRRRFFRMTDPSTQVWCMTRGRYGERPPRGVQIIQVRIGSQYEFFPYPRAIGVNAYRRIILKYRIVFSKVLLLTFFSEITCFSFIV